MIQDKALGDIASEIITQIGMMFKVRIEHTIYYYIICSYIKFEVISWNFTLFRSI